MGAIIVLIFRVLLVFLVVSPLLKILWPRTIPYLFPGAVEQGLIAPSISWSTVFKISIFVAVLTVVCAGGTSTYTTTYRSG